MKKRLEFPLEFSLQVGSTGPEVAALQQLLCTLAHLPEGQYTPGVFDAAATKPAVQSYQTWLNREHPPCRRTGGFGEATWNAMPDGDREQYLRFLDEERDRAKGDRRAPSDTTTAPPLGYGWKQPRSGLDDN